MIKTSLHSHHERLSAKILPYAGFLMPISYPKGIASEYFSVRDKVGMFDVSHMGEFRITGLDAEKFLQKITINDVSRLDDNDIQYSAMCLDDGGIIDDLLLYKFNSTQFLMVVNASNIEKDFKWISKHASADLKIENVSNDYSLIALQGPDSRDVIERLFNISVKVPFYKFMEIYFNEQKIILSRTGYTGELGYEIYSDHKSAVEIWSRLIDLDVVPCGLAVRDILRMEMKYCLYGNDITEKTNPIEAGLGWITSLNKGNFIGKDAILTNKKVDRKLVSFILLERGIPRKDYDIFSDKEKIGKVTSGTQSLKLKNGIGLGYVDVNYSDIGNEIYILIREKKVKAKIIKAPFIKNTSLLK